MHPGHLTFRSSRQGPLELRYQRAQIFQAIGRRLKNYHHNGKLREMLLEGKVAVRSSQADLRFTFHASRFTAVGSAARTPQADFVNSLLGGVSRSNRQHASFSFFEKGNHLLARNRGKSVKELVNGLPAFQILDKCLYRHAGAAEHGCTAEDIRA